MYAIETMDRSLKLIVGHSNRDESDRPGSLSAHSANCLQLQSRTRAASDSWNRPMCNTPWSSTPASHGATDPCDFPGIC